MKELRADARRNRDQILRAAHLVFLDQGPDAPLDQIATRAGVGNATLYRHFPARADLVGAVVQDNMARVAAFATDALAGERPLATFAARVIEHQAVAMLPILGGHVVDDAAFREVRDRLLTVLGELVDAARADGTLRADVSRTDLVMFFTVLTRPLPTVSGDLDELVRARLLATVLDGLRPGGSPLPGEQVTAARITADMTSGGRLPSSSRGT